MIGVNIVEWGLSIPVALLGLAACAAGGLCAESVRFAMKLFPGSDNVRRIGNKASLS